MISGGVKTIILRLMAEAEDSTNDQCQVLQYSLSNQPGMQTYSGIHTYLGKHQIIEPNKHFK